MNVVVADASSLILTAKVAVLRIYAKRVRLVVPARVLREVASPALCSAHPDAREIAAAAEEGTFEVRSVRSRKRLPLSLGAGEAAAIRLFHEIGGDLVLSDDGRAIRTCRLLGIPFTTTPRVVVDLVRKNSLGLAHGRRALEKLAVIGRYAPEIIAAALTALQED